MADVFLSYKREERLQVERLAIALRGLGLSVWFDASLAAGDAFSDEIDREARRARVVVVCWSPLAAGSQWGQPIRLEIAANGRSMGAVCNRLFKIAFKARGEIVPENNPGEFDVAAGRYVQTKLNVADDSVISRYPNESQLAFSRGVNAYFRAA